jgi:hypothetical protein
VDRTSPNKSATESEPTVETVDEEEEGDNSNVESEMNKRYGEHTRHGLRPRKPRSYTHQ